MYDIESITLWFTLDLFLLQYELLCVISAPWISYIFIFVSKFPPTDQNNRLNSNYLVVIKVMNCFEKSFFLGSPPRRRWVIFFCTTGIFFFGYIILIFSSPFYVCFVNLSFK